MALSMFSQLDQPLFGIGLSSRPSPTPPNLKMELKEQPKQYELSVEAAGINKENLKISFENGILVVSVEHKQEKQPSPNERIHFSERTYGYSCRKIRLPSNIDSANITAKYENGLVNICIPKTGKQESANYIRIQ
jgi:HSP20 family protein